MSSLDKPNDWEQMAAIAEQAQKRKLLAEQQELESIRQCFKQRAVPKQ